MRRVFIVADALGPTEPLMPVFTRAGFAPPTLKNSLEDVTEAVRNGQADLLAVPLSVIQGRGRFDLETLLRDAPAMGSIGTAPSADAELILSGMRSGIGEFLVTPPSPTDLASALVRLQRKWGTAAVRGTVTAVYSPKGGLGATTVAVNLAHSLARRGAEARVAIIDLNMGLGDVTTHLNLQCEYDVGDLVRKLDQADPELLHAIVTPFGDGLFALPACDDVEMADSIQAVAVSRMLSICRGGFTHTVVDCEHSFGHRTVAALDAADHIVLVLQSNVAAIRAVKRTLTLFQQLDYSTDRVVVVVNRVGSGDVLSLSDIAKALGRPIDIRLPNAFQLTSDAQTRGIPVAQLAPTAPLVTTFDQLATKVGGEIADAQETNGRPSGTTFGRLFGRKRN